MNTSKWFERKFDFSFDVNEYPVIYQRLQGAPDQLATILRTGSKPDQFTSPFAATHADN